MFTWNSPNSENEIIDVHLRQLIEINALACKVFTG